MTEHSQKDKIGIKLGMWLFLYTEIMLFGGLFVLYAAYHQTYTADFVQAGKELNLAFGTVNTIFLLCSSCAVAASITAVRKGASRLAIKLLVGAVSLGLVFMVNKFFEWSSKFAHGIYPNSSVLTKGEPGVNVFFGLYYIVTGLHGVHVLIGMILLAFCAVKVRSGQVRADDYVLLDNCGLYWHLVDLIWIFVFPLFYLIV